MKKLLTLLAITYASCLSAQIISDDIETWIDYKAGFPFPTTPLEIPKGWHGSDSLACTFGPLLDPSGNFVKQIFKTTDKHSGSFAARLVTKNLGTVGVLPAVMSNANSMELDTSQTIPIKLFGGVPVSMRLDYANAWIKFKPAVAGEETQMYVEAVIAGAGTNGDDLVVGTGQAILSETTSWQVVSTDIVYNNTTVVPTHIRVVFFSSFGNPNDGTELLVDDVSVSLFPVGIERQFDNENTIKVYPTVSNGIINIEPDFEGQMTFTVRSITGQVLAKKEFSGKAVIDLSHISNGSYFYTISYDKTVMQQGRVSIVK